MGYFTLKTTIIFVLLTGLSWAQDWSVLDSKKWQRTVTDVRDHVQFVLVGEPEIVLKTSKVNMKVDGLKGLSDQKIMDQVFSGKTFSDKVYENTEIKMVSQSIKKESNAVLVLKQESFKNSKGTNYFRINKVILKDHHFFNAELIWPAQKDSLIKTGILKEFEQLDVL